MTPGTTFEIKGKHFLDWYDATAKADAEMIWAKAKEYGGFDNQAVALGQLTGHPQVGLVINVERAVAFNAAQKMARIVEALGRGEVPSEDTWRDLVCYGMIARRLRETKTWPA